MRGLIEFVVLISLILSAAETSGQCVVTPLPVGDAATSSFNSQVDLDGDIAVIADVTDDLLGDETGAVKVRRFNGSVWVEEASLTASNAAAEDWYGSSVAVSGDVIAVGSPEYGDPTKFGSTYIYRYNPATMTWDEEAILTQQAPLAVVAFNAFGATLALDGNVLAIAGTTVNGLSEDVMGAHIFRYNPTNMIWEFEQVVTIGEEQVVYWYPNNWLALEGNVLVGGDPQVSGLNKKGAVWIHRFDGAIWNLDVMIPSPTPISASTTDFFGISVDVLGDMAVIGAISDTEPIPSNKIGAVYVYEYDGANWGFTQKVVSSFSAPNDGRDFGISLSLAADAMLVGAGFESQPIPAISQAGSVYHYKREGVAWVEQGRMFAPDAMASDRLSRMGIAISGDRAIISSSRTGDVTGLGLAYIIDGVRGIGGPDCNNNGIADYCEILDAVVADTNANGIPDECEAIINAGQTAIINSSGGSGEPVDEPLVEASNLTGAAGSTVSVDVSSEDLHPGAGEFGVFDTTVAVETSMNDGEFLITLTVPFDDVDLAGDNWQSVELLFFNTLTSTWELAVLGNTVNSPGFASPAGDRILSEDSVDHNLASLSNDVGDFGVFWNNVTLTGFAWANVDHTTDFSIGIDLCPADTNDSGSVNVTDLLELLALWGTCPGLCRSDTNKDGNVNVTDLLALLAAWGVCP